MTVLFLETNESIKDYVCAVLQHHKIDFLYCDNLIDFEALWTEKKEITAIITAAVVSERDMFSYSAYLGRKIRRKLPVISYSREDIASNALRAAQAGIYHFMGVPFTPDELLGVLGQIDKQNEPIIVKKFSRKSVEPEEQGLSAVVDDILRSYFEAHEGLLPPNGLYDRVVSEVERPLIKICLDYTKGNRLKASELLGINRNTLRKKMKELALD